MPIEGLSMDMVLYLLGAGFLSAFIDAAVGGGGLISTPALMMTGLPMSTVLGTNKLASMMGSLTSTLSFLHSGKIDKRLAGRLFPLAVGGAAAGAFTVRFISPDFMRQLVIVMLLLVTVYTLFKKDWGAVSTYAGLKGRAVWLCPVVAIVLGYYDGFFGPGTGSFLIFAFLMFGFDFVVAAGNAKVLNFGSNIGALLTFVSSGSVYYSYGLVMGAAMVVGAYAGSRVAITQGVRYVKPLFLVVSITLVGKQVWQLFH